MGLNRDEWSWKVSGRVVGVSGGVMSDRPGGAMQVWPVIKWGGVCTLLQQWDVDYGVQRHPERSVML